MVGKRRSSSSRSSEKLVKSDSIFTRVPSDPPPFTVGDLRRAIPKHCFERSWLKSSAYLLADLVAAAALYCAASFLASPGLGLPAWLRYGLVWPVYWFLQGAVCTGLWVIAHECGHGAFSDHSWLNDSVGFVVHSLLLVPYFSWKYSHARHHKNTGNVRKDEVFVPPITDRPAGAAESDNPAQHNLFYRAGLILFSLLLGWPLYLIANVSGREYPRWASHFDPWSPIFTAKQRAFIALSDAGMVGAACLWAGLAQAFGWSWLAKAFGVPYLMVNMWLVMITLLQHTHPSLPHYEDWEWDWLRGALATVDRSYGPLLDALHHHIADTHVCHHLFSDLPHYHAQEATAALRPLLGPYYLRDPRPIHRALWEDMGRCGECGPDKKGEGVYWY